MNSSEIDTNIFYHVKDATSTTETDTFERSYSSYRKKPIVSVSESLFNKVGGKENGFEPLNDSEISGAMNINSRMMDIHRDIMDSDVFPRKTERSQNFGISGSGANSISRSSGSSKMRGGRRVVDLSSNTESNKDFPLTITDTDDSINLPRNYSENTSITSFNLSTTDNGYNRDYDESSDEVISESELNLEPADKSDRSYGESSDDESSDKSSEVSEPETMDEYLDVKKNSESSFSSNDITTVSSSITNTSNYDSPNSRNESSNKLSSSSSGRYYKLVSD